MSIMTIGPTTIKRFGSSLLLGLLTLLAVFVLQSVPGHGQDNGIPATEISEQLNQGQALYETGQLTEAEQLLESVLMRSQNALTEAVIRSNLALVYGQRGQWDRANQAIADSLVTLVNQTSPTGISAWGQALDVQGRLQFGQGQPEAALKTWQQAEVVYRQINNPARVLRSQIRQAKALQAMGFHRRAVNDILTNVKTELATQPDSALKASGLRQLAEALKTTSSLQTARETAEASLAVSKKIDTPGLVAATQLTLGNIIYLQAQNAFSLLQARGIESRTENQAYETLLQYRRETLEAYQQAIDSAASQNEVIKAALNHLNALVEFEQTSAVDQRWPEIYTQLQQQPASQENLYAQINFVSSLLKLAQQNRPEVLTSAQSILEIAQTNAQQLNHRQALAYILGQQGQLEEQQGHFRDAIAQTEQALIVAQAINAKDITYRWQEQLGHIQEKSGNLQGAIIAYKDATNTLKTLRTDLYSINADLQFSFEKSVEPLHRKLIELLLNSSRSATSTGDLAQARAIAESLQQARKTVESLRQEELNNYLRAACLDGAVNADSNETIAEQTINSKTAIIHTIILDKSLELIVEFEPGNELKHYTTQINRQTLNTQLTTLENSISEKANSVNIDFVETATDLYNTILRAKDHSQTLDDELATRAIDTLVFVPDGNLRNVNFSVLYNDLKNKFLLQQYQVAITPGISLITPRVLQRNSLSALTFGLTESKGGFPALPSVQKELKEICKLVTCDTNLDQSFTKAAFQETVQTSSAPIVHLATHGQFGSQLDETFILTWDENVTTSDLNQWLQQNRQKPLELLVLSACETARGDDRAALGLAGVAVRASANSTLATLWQVDDAVTAIVMPEFYRALLSDKMTRAQALQTAQLFLIENYPEYEHPYYWAPFILVGSWF